MSRTPQELVDGLPSLGSSSHVYEGLCNALDNPKASVSDFGEIIGNDPDLTARLLQLANSAFYGYPRRIQTVSEAVIMIGVQQVRELVSASAVVEYFKGISSDWVNMTSFWEHSLACGISARILAAYHRQSNTEQLFAAGLMHDLGRLVLFIREPVASREIFNRYLTGKKPSLLEVEREVLGFDHAELGATLLETWELPPSLVDAVRHHHTPLDSVQDPSSASIIHLGDVFAHAMEFGGSGERFVPGFQAKVWSRIGVNSDLIRSSVKEIDRQFSDVVGVFIHWIVTNEANES